VLLDRGALLVTVDEQLPCGVSAALRVWWRLRRT
jgi:hypothetical protein